MTINIILPDPCYHQVPVCCSLSLWFPSHSWLEVHAGHTWTTSRTSCKTEDCRRRNKQCIPWSEDIWIKSYKRVKDNQEIIKELNPWLDLWQGKMAWNCSQRYKWHYVMDRGWKIKHLEWSDWNLLLLHKATNNHNIWRASFHAGNWTENTVMASTKSKSWCQFGLSSINLIPHSLYL